MMQPVQYLQARLNVDRRAGAAAVEYALLVALIAIAIIAAVGHARRQLNAPSTTVTSTLLSRTTRPPVGPQRRGPSQPDRARLAASSPAPISDGA